MEENKNKVFLKEESLFISNINNLYKAKEYDKIGALRYKVFENTDLYKKTNTIFQVASSLFFGRYFEECVSFIEELRKREIEDMKYSFYLLASLVAIDDIYMAKSYLSKSKLMNSSLVKEYILEDGANYSTILNTNDIDNIPTLLLINFINEYDKEGKDVEKDYIEENKRIYKYFEMIDDMYMAHYDIEIIDYMLNIGKLLFEN